MSHLSRGRCKIKDLFTLREVVEQKGLKIKEVKQMRGNYIGRINCEFVITDGHGQIAVVDVGNNEYELQMDNWQNSIVGKAGHDGSLLTRDYQTEVHKKEAQLLGGIIAGQEVDSQGYVYLEVHTP